MTPVNAGDDVIVDFDQGGFGGVILAIRRLNQGEEVMSNGMMSESGINGALEKFGNKTEVGVITLSHSNVAPSGNSNVA